MYRVFISACVTIALTGCTSIPAVTFARYPDKGKSTDNSTELAMIDASYQDAFAECIKTGKHLQDTTTRTGYVDLTITAVGIAAGAIVVPALAAKAAAKSAIAAWGGVSGATNAYQYAEAQKGLGPAQYAAVYTQMTTQMVTAMHNYQDAGNDPRLAKKAVGDLIVACQFPNSAEIASASAPTLPNPPKNVKFVPVPGDTTKGTIIITPPLVGAGYISDYTITISPAVTQSLVDAKDPSAPQVSLSGLKSGTYTVVARSKNSVGESLPSTNTFNIP